MYRTHHARKQKFSCTPTHTHAHEHVHIHDAYTHSAHNACKRESVCNVCRCMDSIHNANTLQYCCSATLTDKVHTHILCLKMFWKNTLHSLTSRLQQTIDEHVFTTRCPTELMRTLQPHAHSFVARDTHMCSYTHTRTHTHTHINTQATTCACQEYEIELPPFYVHQNPPRQKSCLGQSWRGRARSA
jgi:hypothetical protein